MKPAVAKIQQGVSPNCILSSLEFKDLANRAGQVRQATMLLRSQLALLTVLALIVFVSHGELY